MLLPQPWVKVLSTSPQLTKRAADDLSLATEPHLQSLYWEVFLFIFYYYNRITKTAIATTTREKAIQVLAYGGGKFKIGQPRLVRTSCCYNSWQKEKGTQGKDKAQKATPLYNNPLWGSQIQPREKTHLM